MPRPRSFSIVSFSANFRSEIEALECRVLELRCMAPSPPRGGLVQGCHTNVHTGLGSARRPSHTVQALGQALDIESLLVKILLTGVRMRTVQMR